MCEQTLKSSVLQFEVLLKVCNVGWFHGDKKSLFDII